MTCNLLHERHEKHVMVDGEVGLLKDRSKLKLVWRNLVVTCLARDAQLQSLDLQVFHEGLYALGDGTEIVVIHLLVLGRVVTHQGAACEHEVGASRVETLVNEEIFLLPTEVADNLLYFRIEIVAYFCGCHVYGVKRAKQRCLVVECLACVRDEDCGDTQRVVDDEHGRCGIPSRVATGLECVTDTAVRERAGIGLLLYEQLARELLYHATLAVVLNERVVLLGSAFGKGLEPVGVVCHAVLVGPLLDALSHSVGN